jgi:hypothetical protein
MPDDQKPALSNEALEALSQQVSNSVLTGINDMRMQERQRQDQLIAQQRDAQARQAAAQHYASDPVAQTITPIVGPALQQLALQTAAVNDKADFYIGHPEAVEFRKQIESKFQEMLGQGRAMDRDSIWTWFKGDNEDLFFDRRQKQLVEAQQRGASVGGSSMARGEAGIDMAEFQKKSADEMAKILAGRTF